VNAFDDDERRAAQRVCRLHYEFAGSSLRGERKEDAKGVAMAESIREVRTVRPRSLERESTVMEAARLMRDEGAGLIPVVKKTTIVGTVTDRDSAIRVAVGAERSPEAATIDPQHGLGGSTRKVVEGTAT
jgi:signal-transduction protein with cAMP-binding, CBS, and nucleotidyltransferase domain